MPKAAGSEPGRVAERGTHGVRQGRPEEASFRRASESRAPEKYSEFHSSPMAVNREPLREKDRTPFRLGSPIS